MAVKDYSTTPASNTTISGIACGPNMPRENVDNAFRQQMADAKRHLFEVRYFDGAANGSTDDTTACEATIVTAGDGTVTFPSGTTRLNAVDTKAASLLGVGQTSILKANSTDCVLRLGNDDTPSRWTKRGVRNLTIDGNSKASDGVKFQQDVSTELSGRWTLDTVTLVDCNRGFYKPNGNIGNSILDTSFYTCNYGYYAVSQTSPEMHAGADEIHRCHFENISLAAIYIDSDVATGGHSIRDTRIEGNAGFGIFVKNYGTSFTPLVLDNVWFELNATAGSVTINAVAYTPKDLYLEDCERAILSNGIVPKLKLVNSHLSIRDCFASADTSTYEIDSTSTITATGLHINAGAHPIIVKELVGARRELGNFVQRFYCDPRTIKSFDQGGVLQSVTFANADTHAFTGSAAVNATTVADGRIFDSCAEMSVAASYTLLQPNFTITNGSWYVITCDFKHVSGALAELALSVNDGTAAVDWSTLLITGKWQSLATVGKCTSTGTVRLRLVNGNTGAQVVRLSAFQAVEFATEREALDFYNSGAFKMATSQGRETFSTAAPTTGTWRVGDKVWNTATAAAGVPGWVCTTAGAPGTWKAMAAVAA